MEKFETTPTLRYGSETTTEKVGDKDIQVEWTAALGEDQEGMEWDGKVVGKGSDGSEWEGEGHIYRVNTEGKTVALNIDNITTTKLIKESVE
ncbi:hypothetical protein IT401_02715 [Candidatus Nomurabacteria bacterium]|nr:hypothetical protein [Candidatus Nomurabacteria bacterium]